MSACTKCVSALCVVALCLTSALASGDDNSSHKKTWLPTWLRFGKKQESAKMEKSRSRNKKKDDEEEARRRILEQKAREEARAADDFFRRLSVLLHLEEIALRTNDQKLMQRVQLLKKKNRQIFAQKTNAVELADLESPDEAILHRHLKTSADLKDLLSDTDQPSRFSKNEIHEVDP
ncbi:MAG: hypothetical protein KatS3mg105_1746 [Gemmatales bacterium]|nr:MAG: hypothetical protein KatS3mg105_1746 [Gemmatales bacterium]